jgi:ribosomal protein L20A (L18A)
MAYKEVGARCQKGRSAIREENIGSVSQSELVSNRAVTSLVESWMQQ